MKPGRVAKRCPNLKTISSITHSLDSLKTLVLRLRNRRKLQKKGGQQTTAAGHTREFKDHRSYVPGDDYRNIDWRLYARLERLFIRIFEEVQEFHVHIIVDCSRSMAAPYSDKRIAALRLAVALAYVALAGQHKVSIIGLGHRCERLVPPVKGRALSTESSRHSICFV